MGISEEGSKLVQFDLSRAFLKWKNVRIEEFFTILNGISDQVCSFIYFEDINVHLQRDIFSKLLQETMHLLYFI